MRKLVVCLIVLGLMGGAAYAGGVQGNWDSGHDRGMLKTFEKLNLTQAQQHDIAVVLKNNRDEGRALRGQLHAAMQGLKQAIDSGAGEAAVRDAFKPVSQVGENMAVHRAKVQAAIKAVLTPEQAKIMEQERSTRMAKRADKMKGHMEQHRSAMDNWVDEHAK